MTLLRLAVPVAVVVGLVLWFATRSDMRWVTVFEADAATRQSVDLELLLDFCDTNVTVPAARVTETVSEVHVLIPLKVRDYGDSKSCAQSPISLPSAHPAPICLSGSSETDPSTTADLLAGQRRLVGSVSWHEA